MLAQKEIQLISMEFTNEHLRKGVRSHSLTHLLEGKAQIGHSVTYSQVNTDRIVLLEKSRSHVSITAKAAFKVQ